MVCDGGEGRVYCLRPFWPRECVRGVLFSESLQWGTVRRSGRRITGPREQKDFLVPVSRRCDCRAPDQIVTQGGCLPGCDSSVSVPVPTLSSESAFHTGRRPACWIHFQSCPPPCLAVSPGAVLRLNHPLTPASVVWRLTRPDGRQASWAVLAPD